MNIIDELKRNHVLWIAILSWFIAQVLKIFIDMIRFKKVKLSLIMSSGGMPSSHSSFVTAMSTTIGLKEGFNSTLFAVSTIISLIVMYDAAGVRRAAGKQAEVLNQLVVLFESSGIKLDKKLKELLGHSPIEVFCGALLGITVALMFFRY